MSQVVLIPIDQKPMPIIINSDEVEIVWENVRRRNEANREVITIDDDEEEVTIIFLGHYVNIIVRRRMLQLTAPSVLTLSTLVLR